jgi:hypothetical protein
MMQGNHDEKKKGKAKESKTKASPVPSLPKPQFKELIALQTSQGYWKPESRELLQRFFAKPLPQGMPDIVLCTLAALYVLESVF